MTVSVLDKMIVSVVGLSISSQESAAPDIMSSVDSDSTPANSLV